MANSASVNWNVRPSGADTNGGGFDSSVASPGTDYSLQDAPQVSFTDLVIGGTTTQLTSAGNPFSSTSPGNIINLPGGGGFTAGLYTVVSVSGVTATMDRSVGTAASTGGTGKLGGAFATVAQAFTALNVASQKINIKNGTFTQTVSLTPPNLSFYISGYNATPGDQGTPPLITTATNSTELLQIQSPIWINNVSFSNTAGTPSNGIVIVNRNIAWLSIQNCIFNGFTNHINDDNIGAHFFINGTLSLFNNKFIGGTNHLNCYQTTVNAKACYFKSPTQYAIWDGNAQTNRFNLIDCTIYAPGSYGLYLQGGSSSASLWGCNFVSGTSDGVHLGNSGSWLEAQDCIFYNNGGWGINNSTASVVLLYGYNAFGSNTSGNVNNVSLFGNAGIIALSGDPFTAKASDDFTLNGAAGAACKAAGTPGATFFGTGYRDIGALQHQASAASAILFNPGFTGNLQGT